MIVDCQDRARTEIYFGGICMYMLPIQTEMSLKMTVTYVQIIANTIYHDAQEYWLLRVRLQLHTQDGIQVPPRLV